MDYLPSYQVHMVKNTTQEQLQSFFWPLGLGMTPEMVSFVEDPSWSIEVMNRIVLPILLTRKRYIACIWCILKGCVRCADIVFQWLQLTLQRPNSQCVTEPISSLPQIYGDASVKLSHMASQPARGLCRGYRHSEKGREIMS